MSEKEVVNSSIVLLVLVCSILVLFASSTFAYEGLNSAEGTTPSNVTVGTWIGMTFSSNLTAGILFGIVNDNSTANDATGNHEEVDGNTTYNVTSLETNTAAIDLCIKDNANLTSEANDMIDNLGYFYTFGLVNDATLNITQSYPVTYDLSYSPTQINSVGLIPAQIAYVRFWLAVNEGVPTGNYNNTVYIKAIEHGASC